MTSKKVAAKETRSGKWGGGGGNKNFLLNFASRPINFSQDLSCQDNSDIQ